MNKFYRGNCSFRKVAKFDEIGAREFELVVEGAVVRQEKNAARYSSMADKAKGMFQTRTSLRLKTSASPFNATWPN
jgi:hypothetical protein